MICANFATFTVAGGTLAATGTVYPPPCNPMDSVVMTQGEYVAVVPVLTNTVDFQQSGSLFSIVFISTVSFFITVRFIGSILEFIKAKFK